ncbi:MAG: tRNA (N(6)-L-threonylcarbamoyladenosine(37)-C(2))-methylthiotransferase MtaB [Proteobacteria bacterium]|nr:tRNA (N(6)-L-threonylcarbamoyladenosine(37)-C(2))-methylthiotransferase MtaB [Pseudomonadota bacterium]MBU4009279.1 tRNA (N(6)-L-threonylcarbamoyladenosine(37)-C(2))-methylthiotransferase MtaB [Pseudomonadota bacterium]MBU4036401.1 tRNA (N(6)-L-threonylcarbamoyladenosine(37)-C(2))-methylthiotransferase MtaB [Pseudomonadota bacterium]
MPKFVTTTLGCKVNQCESESISKYLVLSGWLSAEDGTGADICIINTCTVTAKASMQSRQAIRRAIRSNPEAKIIVTGCYAETEPDELKKINGVHHIIGQKEKHKILSIANSCFSDDSDILHNEDFIDNNGFMRLPALHSESRTRVFLKIQDGCDAFCTYCIVPYARGKSRSMPFETVIESIKNIKKAGHREVVLSGIHIGKYGLDLSSKTSLFELLKLLESSNIIDRIRISSIEPNELLPEIIELTEKSDIICPHFHIPLQSGDNEILKKMRRPYTSEFFKDLINRINNHMPDAAIGVDILVGFPGETDQAFENTYSLIHELPVSYLHVFPFSPRKNTVAENLTGRVPADIVKSRCAVMRKLGNLKKASYYKKAVGTDINVLIEEKRDPQSNLLKGLSSNYIPVLINGDDCIKNSIVKVNIQRAYGNYVEGKI